MSSFISVDFLFFRAFLPFCFLRLLKVPLVLSFQGKNIHLKNGNSALICMLREKDLMCQLLIFDQRL